MERTEGVEPSRPGWKPGYAPRGAREVVPGRGIEPRDLLLVRELRDPIAPGMCGANRGTRTPLLAHTKGAPRRLGLVGMEPPPGVEPGGPSYEDGVSP